MFQDGAAVCPLFVLSNARVNRAGRLFVPPGCQAAGKSLSSGGVLCCKGLKVVSDEDVGRMLESAL